jgi:hypothetical protein
LARTALDKLVDLVLRLEAEVCDLRRHVKELQARLALNSRNSSKPPSSDGLAKPPPKSLRHKSARRPGGQLEVIRKGQRGVFEVGSTPVRSDCSMLRGPRSPFPYRSRPQADNFFHFVLAS